MHDKYPVNLQDRFKYIFIRFNQVAQFTFSYLVSYFLLLSSYFLVNQTFFVLYTDTKYFLILEVSIFLHWPCECISYHLHILTHKRAILGSTLGKEENHLIFLPSLVWSYSSNTLVFSDGWLVKFCG